MFLTPFSHSFMATSFARNRFPLVRRPTRAFSFSAPLGVWFRAAQLRPCPFRFSPLRFCQLSLGTRQSCPLTLTLFYNRRRRRVAAVAFCLVWEQPSIRLPSPHITSARCLIRFRGIRSPRGKSFPGGPRLLLPTAPGSIHADFSIAEEPAPSGPPTEPSVELPPVYSRAPKPPMRLKE